MIILIILGIVLIILGLIGCIVPVLPGPPLSYLALILLEVAKNGDAFSSNQLILWGVVTVAVTALDYIIPVAGAKKYGATKYGMWGSVIGMLVGILFPPFGLFIGAFAGALIGELAVGKTSRSAIKAGWGTFMGIIFGMGLKLAASLAMAYSFFRALF